MKRDKSKPPIESISINPNGWAITVHTQRKPKILSGKKFSESPLLQRILAPTADQAQQHQRFHHDVWQKFSREQFGEFHALHFCVNGQEEAKETARQISLKLCKTGIRHHLWIFPAQTFFIMKVARKKTFRNLGEKEDRRLDAKDKAFMKRAQKIPGLWWANEGERHGQMEIKGQAPGIFITNHGQQLDIWRTREIPIIEPRELLESNPHLEHKETRLHSHSFLENCEKTEPDFTYEKTLEESMRASTQNATMKKPHTKI